MTKKVDLISKNKGSLTSFSSKKDVNEPLLKIHKKSSKGGENIGVGIKESSGD